MRRPTPSPTSPRPTVEPLERAPARPTAIINLTTAGTVTGATTRYAGNNAMAPATGGLSPTCRVPGHQVMFQYTARTTSRLRVTTSDMGTAFDTVAWATTACATTGTELGCNDDSTGATPALSSRFTTTSIVRAGMTIFIGVGGYLTASGAYVLLVTEVPEVALGVSCDPAGLANACVSGSSCSGTGTAAICVADGAPGGTCRTATGTTACDPGLVCQASVCVTPVAIGGTCGTSTAPCESGSTCLSAVCVANGAVGGRCRTTTPACATGLGCTGDPADSTTRCRTTVALGGACDATRATNVCVTGSVCLASVPSGPTTCQNPPYVESVLTAPTWIDACATGGTRVVLATGGGRDDNHAATAATLPFTFQFVRAPVTTVWAATNGYAQFTTAPSDSTGGVGSIPDTGEGAIVAPFWDDLVLRAPVAPSTDESLCLRTVGTAPNRQFAIEWFDVYRYTHNATRLTFEVVLSETTNTVDFIYNTLTGTGADAVFVDGSRATVGLQSAAGAVSLLHTGTVTTTTGIRFTPR